MTSDPSGVIEPGRLYLAEDVRRRLRNGDWGWRQMRRDGLRVIYQGKRSYVFGDDILRFFADRLPNAADGREADG